MSASPPNPEGTFRERKAPIRGAPAYSSITHARTYVGKTKNFRKDFPHITANVEHIHGYMKSPVTVHIYTADVDLEGNNLMKQTLVCVCPSVGTKLSQQKNLNTWVRSQYAVMGLFWNN